MKTYVTRIYLCKLLLGGCVLAGCGGSGEPDSHAVTVAAEAGHEGHNHGPGGHGINTSPVANENSAPDWCLEHAVPESECTQCNPSLADEFKNSGDWCAGHDLPESHCRICNPGLTFPQEEVFRAGSVVSANDDIEVTLQFRRNTSVCATDGALIQFASPVTAERAGITVQTARASSMEFTIDAPAEVVFDETEATVVTTTVPALVSRWLVAPGEVVREGDVLAILKSPDIASLKSSLITAYAKYEVERDEMARHLEMMDRNLISKADLDRQSALAKQAHAEFAAARGLLLSAGLSENDLGEITEHGVLTNEYVLRAPTSGMIMNRIAQLGELLDAGKAFATIANPAAMWIEAHLTETLLKNVEAGQRLTFSSDGQGINRVGAEIIWVSRFLDPHSRTGTVRANVLDPGHKLHAGEFGRVKIVKPHPQDVVLIPKDAVQWEGCCNVVFVREQIDRYRPRKVQLLESDGTHYQVADGVQPGEDVVVSGAFLLKTELKKSSIGVGCCGLEPVG